MTKIKIPHTTSHSPYASLKGIRTYINMINDLIRPLSITTQRAVWHALLDGTLKVHRENDIDGTVILEVAYA